jgi:hypothetical protein
MVPLLSLGETPLGACQLPAERRRTSLNMMIIAISETGADCQGRAGCGRRSILTSKVKIKGEGPVIPVRRSRAVYNPLSG